MTARIPAGKREVVSADMARLQAFLDVDYGGNVVVEYNVWPNGRGMTIKARALDADGPGAKLAGATRRRSHYVDWVVWGQIAAALLWMGYRNVRAGKIGQKAIEYKTMADLLRDGPGAAGMCFQYDPDYALCVASEGTAPVMPQHQAINRGEAEEVLKRAVARVKGVLR